MSAFAEDSAMGARISSLLPKTHQPSRGRSAARHRCRALDGSIGEGPLNQPTRSIFHDGGDTGERLRALDWAASPLGPISAWPSALRALVGVMLAANQPMIVVWGPGLTLLYNDAYRAVLGHKHPGALGGAFLDV
jgi:hypothetical protein